MGSSRVVFLEGVPFEKPGCFCGSSHFDEKAVQFTKFRHIMEISPWTYSINYFMDVLLRHIIECTSMRLISKNLINLN